MAEIFDPYYTWLGIPPHEQPANHYRLLGISQFEANDEVISNAADRLMLHLRAFQAGKRSKESQQLLNEISAARVTLLDPAKKQKYDAELRATLAAAGPPGGSPPEALPVARPLNLPPSSAIQIAVAQRPKALTSSGANLHPPARRSQQTPLILVVAFIAAALLAVGGGIAFLISRNASTQSVVNVPPPHEKADIVHPDNGKVTPPVEHSPQPSVPDRPPGESSTAQNFTPPTEQPKQWQNLLALVDSGAERQLTWQMENGALVTPLPASGKKGATRRIARLTFPIVPLGEYHLKLKLAFEGGDQTAVIILPVADREVAFSINAFAGGQQRSGFERISGQRVDQNPTGTNSIQPQTGEEHELELIVRPQGSQAKLYALWDGQPASHWEGTLDQLGQLERFSPIGDMALCLCTAESAVRFHEVKLGLISGDIRQRTMSATSVVKTTTKASPPSKTPKAKATIAKSLTPAGIDLLELIDASKHAVRGRWSLDGRMLTVSPQPGGSLLQLPIEPPEPYRLEMVLRRQSGGDGIAVVLAAPASQGPARQFAAVIDGNDGNKSYLERLDGRGADPQNPSLRPSSAFATGQLVRLRLEVATGRVRVLADGAPLLDWTGNPNRLSLDNAYYSLPNPRLLGLSSHLSEFRFNEIRILPLNAPELRGPDAAAVAKATQQIHAEHAAAISGAKKGDQKITLARTLREEAERTASDPPRQAALWLEAQKLAAAGGDARLALDVLQDRCAWFALDRLTESAEALKTLMPPVTQRAENYAVAESASQLLDQAIALDRFDAAEQLLKVVGQAYARLKYTDGVSRLNERQIEIGRMKAESEKLDAARMALASSPQDSVANVALGRYQCFFKNDWGQGLPKLALGSDADLQDAAKKDMAQPQIAASRVAVGDLWWEIGQKQPASARRNVLRRAAEWYLLALRDVTGNQRTTLARRIEQAIPSRGEATALVKDGLVSHWSFDEGAGRLAQDTGANKNHATLVNAEWTRGCLGAALKLTADDHYAQFYKRVSGPQGTIAFWTRVDRFGPEMGLITTTDRSRGHVQLSVVSGGRVHAHIGDSANGKSSNPLQLGKWQHIVFRYAGDKCELLIDGALEDSFAANKDIPPIIGPGRLGGWLDNEPGHTLIGAIDDVRLYGRVLTNDEVGALIAAGQGAQ